MLPPPDGVILVTEIDDLPLCFIQGLKVVSLGVERKTVSVIQDFRFIDPDITVTKIAQAYFTAAVQGAGAETEPLGVIDEEGAGKTILPAPDNTGRFEITVTIGKTKSFGGVIFREFKLRVKGQEGKAVRRR
jgi:hypothetical protein